MDTLFAHATLVTMDESLRVIPDGFLGITDCPLLRKSNIVVDNG